jgi:hypothetical protein
MVASQKSVNKEAETYPSYTLNIVFDPKGMRINQIPVKVSPFEVIGALDVVKGLHLKYFHDMMTGNGNLVSPEDSKQMELGE